MKARSYSIYTTPKFINVKSVIDEIDQLINMLIFLCDFFLYIISGESESIIKKTIEINIDQV